MEERQPYTLDELQTLIPDIQLGLVAYEKSYPHIRPVPPLPASTCRDLLLNIFATALVRSLTTDECFLAGQLLSQFGQAMQAELLTGDPTQGFYVISGAHMQYLTMAMRDKS